MDIRRNSGTVLTLLSEEDLNKQWGHNLQDQKLQHRNQLARRQSQIQQSALHSRQDRSRDGPNHPNRDGPNHQNQCPRHQNNNHHNLPNSSQNSNHQLEAGRSAEEQLHMVPGWTAGVTKCVITLTHTALGLIVDVTNRQTSSNNFFTCLFTSVFMSNYRLFLSTSQTFLIFPQCLVNFTTFCIE